MSKAAGLSRTRESFIERGLADSTSLIQWSQLLAIVGLELSVQAFPTIQPLRDGAHIALLARLKGRLHPALRWRTEIPMPRLGDLRGWDGMVLGEGWRVAIEAETRPHDLQALQRRIALKQRDSETETVILLLAASRYNRELVRAYGHVLAGEFPVPGSRAIELLGVGVFPGGNAVILL